MNGKEKMLWRLNNSFPPLSDGKPYSSKPPCDGLFEEVL
jgi:hypothetical protein